MENKYPKSKFEVGDLVEYEGIKMIVKSCGSHWAKRRNKWIAICCVTSKHKKGKPDKRSWNAHYSKYNYDLLETDLNLIQKNYYNEKA